MHPYTFLLQAPNMNVTQLILYFSEILQGLT